MDEELSEIEGTTAEGPKNATLSQSCLIFVDFCSDGTEDFLESCKQKHDKVIESFIHYTANYEVKPYFFSHFL